jgi:MarR family 2-MHQ and catechol resistance regulon transcriptional repressor
MSRQSADDPSIDAWMSIVGAYKAVHVLLNQGLSEAGLTFPQYRVIRTLGKFGAMPMNKIGEHMSVTPANITGLVDRLEGRGYIERKEAGVDRRVVRIELTRRGRALYRETSIHHRRIVGGAMRVLCKDEKLRLTELLRKIRVAALQVDVHRQVK